METILVLTHTEVDGTLSRISLETLSAAKALTAALPGSSLVVGLVGEQLQPGANQIAGCGAQKFFGVMGPDFGQPRYASDAAAAEALARAAQATIVIAPQTARTSRILPGVAHRLKGRAETHVT